MIAKRSKIVAGGCSAAETPGQRRSLETHPAGMPEALIQAPPNSKASVE